MDILNPRSLREDAHRALARGRDPKKLIFTYAGITAGLSLLITLAQLWLEQEISDTGGLSNLGTRAIFSTAQQAIPILAWIVSLCLDLGYLSGMMRISRGLYADHTDLKVGLQKFWPLMRLTVLQYLIYLGLGILAVQLGWLVFAMTPWAAPLMDLTMQIYEMDPYVLDEQLVMQFLELSGPMYIIVGIVFLVLLVPVLYRIRFARFCLLDDPNGRALAAIRTSSKLLRRRFFPLLKIDLSLWMYYAGILLALLIPFIDLILPLLGIALPMDGTVFFLLLSVAGAAAHFFIQVTLRNRTEATYLTAYDRLREKPKEGGPMVLGNIFDM